jgi:hypothetical protein
VDFSWRGVSVDANSIRIQALSHAQQVKLINVSYPPEENALVWQIYSEEAFAEKVRISYLLFQIDSLVDYNAVAEKDEKHLSLKVYAVLRNFSGEDFEKASFNLGFGPVLESGLRHEETRRTLLAGADAVPIKKEFTFDSRELPWDPKEHSENVGIPLRYVFLNTEENGLGRFVFEPGKTRVFQKDGQGSQIFLGEDVIDRQVHKGDEVKLYIGDSRDIVVTQKIMKSRQANIRRNHFNSVILHDVEETLSVKVENFKNEPCELRLIEYIEGEWEMAKAPEKFEKESNEKLVFTIPLAAKEKKDFTINYVKKNIR